MLPFEQRQNLTFLQAGANDGLTQDWLRPWIVENHWRGICLEPQREAFERLRDLYRDFPEITPLPYALSSADHRRPLYRISHPDPDLHRACGPLASFDAITLLENARIELKKFPRIAAQDDPSYLETFLVSEEVECRSLRSLCEEFDLSPDLIALDIEGQESMVIEQLQGSELRPEFLFFEAYHMAPTLKEKTLKLIEELGYEWCWIPEYGIAKFNVSAHLTR